MNQIRGEDWNGGDSELPDTASWTDVAHYVKTRTATQCWNKWLDRIVNQRERTMLYCRVHGLSWKEDGISIRNLWTVSSYVTLIERYYTCQM